MTQQTSFGGIDGGKDTLDLAVFPGGDRGRVTNTPCGHQDVIAWLAARGVTTVGIEASGRYERPVRDALRAAGVTVHVVDPARVRYLAKAQGQRAKTDAIDAAVIWCLSRVAPKARGRGREVESMADTPISCMVVTSFPSGSA
jgi:transposase